MRGNQCRAGAAEQIEHYAAAMGDILNRVGDHRHRLDGRMYSEVVKAAGLQGVNSPILPDIGAVTPVLTELETVHMRRKPPTKKR
jgi:hypothetical protein